MTDSVTPRAPDPPLVDPETGETPPLSPAPRIAEAVELLGPNLEHWCDAIAYALREELEPDDAA